MKLTETNSKLVEKQLGAVAVPEEHPVLPELTEEFGDHTFFLDGMGLSIVEPSQSPESAREKVVKIASWADDEQTELLAGEPELRPVIVELEPDDPDHAA